MHKCPNCGSEFEGKFCPNCGEQWQEEKTCPKCGAKLGGSARFCNECGYSFVKTEEKPKKQINLKTRLNSVWAWIKSHLKIVIPIAVAVVLVIILSCSIPACIKAKNNGTYYKLNYNGELDESTYFILKSGKWEDEDGETGTYKLDGEKIAFYYTFFGETEEMCDGTLVNYVLKVNGDTYVSSKHKHGYGEWKTTREATCVSDGVLTRTCECGVKEFDVIPASEVYHKLENYEIIDEQYHKGICVYCKKEVQQIHNRENCDCGYPYEFSLNADGISYELSKLSKYFNYSVKQVEIPSVYNSLPVTSIGNYTFWSCSGLTSVVIPDSIIAIGDYAFQSCGGLTSITMGNSVTTIGQYAFYCCYSLTGVTIPDSVTTIGKSAFYGCSGLTGELTIPDGVTTIGESAFSGCSGFTSVTIGDSVTSIGDYAFRYCSRLTSVSIPDRVATIGNYVFRDCSGLTDINFGGTMEQWNAVSKGSSWNYTTGNYTVHCTDGDIAKVNS